MAAVMQSPAPIHQSKQRRRRRTRTPKPQSIHSSAIKSRLISPSPFLDRSFQRSRLLFDLSRTDSDNEESSLEYDDPNDSEYDFNKSLLNISQNTSFASYDFNNECKYDNKNRNTKSKSGSCSLADVIENLSINSNTNSNNNSFLLRNARASVKISKNGIQTPKLFDDKPSKSKSKSRSRSRTESNSPNNIYISDVNKPQKLQKTVRITKSLRVFNKSHKFGKLLVKPLECGSGCPLYCSEWKNELSVTKLMPCFENEEFSKEENVDNACREYELHCDAYRKGCKLYGVRACPTVGIYACVDLKHTDDKQYLTFVMPALHCNLAQFVSKYHKLTLKESYMLLKKGLHFLRILRDTNMIHNDIKPENIFCDVGFDEYNGGAFINSFVFGDFGCAALTTEEFPFGALTGTITMWDSEALGERYGDEDGFSVENDLYGFLGSLLDGVYGGSIMEELLEEANERWEDTEWNAYTELIRLCRAKMTDITFMKQELRDMQCTDHILSSVLMQIARPREERMNLDQILRLVD